MVFLGLGVEFHDEVLAVDGIFETLEFFYWPVEPAHEEEADGQAVGDEQGVLRVVGFGEVAEKSFHKAGHAIIDIGSAFAVGDAVEEGAELAAFGFDELVGFDGAEVAKILLAQARVFVCADEVEAILPAGAETREGLAGALVGGEVGAEGLAFENLE